MNVIELLFSEQPHLNRKQNAEVHFKRMIIIYNPNSEKDRTGLPFVGSFVCRISQLDVKTMVLKRESESLNCAIVLIFFIFLVFEEI